MLDLSGTNIVASEAAGRAFAFTISIYWDDITPTNATYDVDNFTISYDARGGEDVLSIGKPVAIHATITLSNRDGAYTYYDPDAALYPYIHDGGWYGKRVEIKIGFKNAAGTPELVTRYIGRIYGWEHRYNEQTIVLQLTDESSFYLMNRQIFSPLYENIKTGDLISMLLNTIPAGVRPPVSTIYSGDVVIPFAWFDGDNPIKEMGDIAALEGGMVRIDEDGAISFQQAGDALGASLGTLSVDYVDSCTVSYEFESTAQKVKVGYRQPLLFYNKNLWKIREPLVIPPGETATIVAQYEPSTLHKLEEYGVYTIGGVDMTADVPFFVRYDATRAVIECDNTLNEDTAVVWELTIAGRQLIFRDERHITAIMRDGEIVFEDYGDDLAESGQLKTIEVMGNWYIQSEGMAKRMAALLLWRATKPTSRIQLNGCGGRFWYDPLDVITVDFGTAQVPAAIYGMELRGTYGNMSINLSLYPIGDFLPYWGNFFVIGTNSIGDGSKYYA